MESIPVKTTRTVSLQSGGFNWEIVDERAYELGLDRSKYTQMLYDLEIKYNLLSNHQLLNSIRNPKRFNFRVIDIVFLLFLLAILSLLIIVTVVI